MKPLFAEDSDPSQHYSSRPSGTVYPHPPVFDVLIFRLTGSSGASRQNWQQLAWTAAAHGDSNEHDFNHGYSPYP